MNGRCQRRHRTAALGHEQPYSNVAGSCRSMALSTQNRTYAARPIKSACRAASNRSATRDRLAGRTLLIGRDDPQFTRRSSSLLFAFLAFHRTATSGLDVWQSNPRLKDASSPNSLSRARSRPKFTSAGIAKPEGRNCRNASRRRANRKPERRKLASGRHGKRATGRARRNMHSARMIAAARRMPCVGTDRGAAVARDGPLLHQ